MIETENLTKRFGDLTAVDDLSPHAHDGEVFGFLGPNGAVGLVMAFHGTIQLVVTGASADLTKSGAIAISSYVDLAGIAGHLLIWHPLWLPGGILTIVIPQAAQTRVMRRIARRFRALTAIVWSVN